MMSEESRDFRFDIIDLIIFFIDCAIMAQMYSSKYMVLKKQIILCTFIQFLRMFSVKLSFVKYTR